MKKRIALLYGGAGAEHSVSVEGYRNIIKYFDKQKYEVIPVFIDESASWFAMAGGEAVPCFPVRFRASHGFLVKGQVIPVDCVFPLLHGDLGEDGVIQGLLRSVGIPFVGEDVAVGSLTADKAYCKMAAESVGVPTAKYVAIRGGVSSENAERICSRELGYPMFIKPTSLGSSIGASAVPTRDGFFDAYDRACRVGGGSVLIEELIGKKRELECAVLIGNAGAVITHPSEILLDGVYGYDEKYKKKTKTTVRSDIDERTYECLVEYSRRLIDAIGIRAISRIDYFLTESGVLFNEINTMPGFTESSMYLKMLDAHGIPPSEVIDRLIKRAGA